MAADAIQLANGDWAVLRLVAVNDVQVDKDSEEYKAMQQKLDVICGQCLTFPLYEQRLRDSAKIIRNSAESDGKEKES